MKYVTQLHSLVLITVRKTIAIPLEIMICEFLKTSLLPATDDCPKRKKERKKES